MPAFDPLSLRNRKKVMVAYRAGLINDAVQTDAYSYLEYACDRFREELEHTMQSQVMIDNELDFQELLRKSKHIIDRIKSKAASSIGPNWHSPTSATRPIISQVNSVNVVNRPNMKAEEMISWHLDVNGYKKEPKRGVSNEKQ